MRRRLNSGDDMTLFPFLAVLICTMGSLIVLLVVVVQQARATATVAEQQTLEADLEAEKRLETLQQEKESIDWKIEVLEESRISTLQELSEKRLLLGNVEDHIRMLRQKLDNLRSQVVDIVEGARPDEDLAAKRLQIAALESELVEAEKEFEKAREDKSQQETSYALVPYKGKNGTSRRPMFIECRRDRVILQPEGITLFGTDFAPPITDGNALAAALRAKREYLMSVGSTDDAEPYPLLVVRPDGSRSYAAARTAMKAWDSEFGYELIAEEVNLDFADADPGMTNAVELAVSVARERRLELQAAAPLRFGRPNREAVTYRASPNGGFERQGGGASGFGGNGNGNGNGFGGDAGFGGPDGSGRGRFDKESRFGGFSAERGPGVGGGYSTSGQANLVSARGSSNGEFGRGSNNSYGEANYSRDASGSFNGSGDGRSFSSSSPGGAGGQGGASGPGGANQQGGTQGNGDAELEQTGPNGATERAGNRAGQTFDIRDSQLGNAQRFADQGGTNASGGPNGSANRAFASTQSGASGGRSGGAAAGSPGAMARGANGQSGGRSGGQANGASGGRANGRQANGGSSAGGPSSGGMNSGTSSAIANRRGANWAVPDRANGTTGVRRPISVVCYANQLVLKPEAGSGEQAEIFPLKKSVRDGVDPLVTALWKRMRSWSVAGPNMYWKPVMKVRVSQGADKSFQELQSLMQGSGIVIERK